MAQIFKPGGQLLLRVAFLTIAGVFLCAAGFGAMAFYSGYFTRQGERLHQPVPFSHQHHVRGLGLDCRYCHNTVENTSFAGMPATKICMTCHSQIWTNSPLLAPIRDSYANNRPIAWTRVHDLPDFVYFDHSVHIHRGIGCVSCHGKITEMPITGKAHSLYMRWCLDCHRHPETQLRPQSEIFNFQPQQTSWKSAALQEAARINTEQIQNCSACHH